MGRIVKTTTPILVELQQSSRHFSTLARQLKSQNLRRGHNISSTNVQRPHSGNVQSSQSHQPIRQSRPRRRSIRYWITRCSLLNLNLQSFTPLRESKSARTHRLYPLVRPSQAILGSRIPVLPPDDSSKSSPIRRAQRLDRSLVLGDIEPSTAAVCWIVEDAEGYTAGSVSVLYDGLIAVWRACVAP